MSYNCAASIYLSGKISKEELATRYNNRQHDFGKLLTLLLIPLLIPVMWLIYGIARLKNHYENLILLVLMSYSVLKLFTGLAIAALIA